MDSDSEDGEELAVVDDEGEDRRWWVDRLLISPRRKVVKRMMRKWYSRWFFLIFLPAFIVSFFLVIRNLGVVLMGRLVDIMVRRSFSNISHRRDGSQQT